VYWLRGFAELPSRCSAEEGSVDLQVLMPVLLGWAVHLSDYPAPEHAPRIEYRLHEFFVDEVCGHRECRVIGWYNDSGTVYVDERLRYEPSKFAQSLLVHEIVHYLQHQSGRFDTFSCKDSLVREREAYSVQNAYLMQVGNAVNPMRPRPTACRYGSGDESPAYREDQVARTDQRP
jgi:hypothetical protein